MMLDAWTAAVEASDIDLANPVIHDLRQRTRRT
jgi:hypothetical protein